jgi:allantoicase
VAFFLNNFQGKIKIEATLDSAPAVDTDWFKVYEFDSTSSATTNNFSTNITGNFTWMRANVEDFSQGTITKLMLSY